MSGAVRVLHVVGAMGIGGAETMVMNLYRQIDRQRVQFDFVVHTDRAGAYDGEIKSLGGRIYSCPRYRGANHLSYINWWKTFLKGHTEYKILHSHIRSTASLYLPIAKRHGLTTIIHCHNTSNGKGIRAAFKDMLQLPLRRQADYLFACSKEAGEWLFGKKAVESERFHVVPNAIDCERFRFDPALRENVRKKLGVEDCFVVGHVGRLTPQKNHSFLFRIFQELLKKRTNAVLFLLGDGELRDQLIKETATLGISSRVIFFGARRNVSDYYQAMDAFVFPSVWEGFPVTMVEAQASGLLCFISDIVTSECILSPDGHMISLKKSPAEWAEKILNTTQQQNRKDGIENVIRAGYDIGKNVRWLENYYLEKVNALK